MSSRLAQKGPLDLPLPGMRPPGRGQKILVAVSGGLDSMVLLHSLKALAPAQNWELFVAHFNHGLRGRASDGDEAFVEKAASAMNLPFHLGRADVRQLAKTEKVSIEMAARQVRHEFFARTASLHRINTVALAHHADDQVELFFLRLLRGAGGSGLAGMQWVSPSPVIDSISLVRPLLDVPRAMLEEFAREHGIRYREDATNLSTDFLRNRTRRELLPLLRRKYQAGLNKTILRSMEITGAESELIAKMAKAWLEQQAFWSGERTGPRRSSFVKAIFEELPRAIQRQVLVQQIIKLGVTPDFELIETLRHSSKRPVAINPHISVSCDTLGQAILHRHRPAAFDDQSVVVNLKSTDAFLFGGVAVKWGFDRAQKYLRMAGKPAAGTEFFDANKIGKEIVLRHWRAGDRFQPIGLRGAAKLQDLFTNAKVPREQRRQLVVAEAGSGIFWVEGLRISENFKLTAKTERVLSWSWRRPGD
jgi:tRNA(Ile)-lysidine synthase